MDENDFERYEILLSKLRAVCSGCVLIVGSNYLQKRSKVLSIQCSDEKYYVGYVSVYCKHATCSCKSNVKGRIKFYFYHDRIEAGTDISGKLNHLNLRKVTIYLLTSCNTEERIAQNIYIHNSNRNYKKLTTTTILIKKRIGIGYKN